MTRIAVCLSGCGVFDGSEIHEAVLTLLALDQAGAQVVCCAPNIPQSTVVNHMTRSPLAEAAPRNVLIEAARIARGNIVDLAQISASQIQALILPGGFGAATNLSTFATQGPECSVDPQVERILMEMFHARKPIGAICIAPALVARVLGKHAPGARLTIGTDKATAAAMERAGAHHCECNCDQILVDEQHLLVSTPAYMLGGGPAEVFEGVRKLVDRILLMAGR